jgi:hypothetical protein
VVCVNGGIQQWEGITEFLLPDILNSELCLARRDKHRKRSIWTGRFCLTHLAEVSVHPGSFDRLFGALFQDASRYFDRSDE